MILCQMTTTHQLVILKSLTRIQDVSKCIGLIVLQLSLENKFYFITCQHYQTAVNPTVVGSQKCIVKYQVGPAKKSTKFTHSPREAGSSCYSLVVIPGTTTTWMEVFGTSSIDMESRRGFRQSMAWKFGESNKRLHCGS